MSILANRIYYVNSENRVSGTSSNFKYQLDIPDEARFDSVCVRSMIIPNSYYLVREGQNKFAVELDGVRTDLVVKKGNYSVRNFPPVILELLDSVEPPVEEDGELNSVWSMEYDSVTGKFAYSYTGVASSVQLKFEKPTNLGNQFGFDEISVNSFVDGKLESANVVDFVSTSTLFLHSDMVQDQSSILQELYSDNTVPFSNHVYNCKYPMMYSKTLQNGKSGVFNFSLCDEHNLEVDLNGHEFLFTLLLYRKENLSETMKKVLQIMVNMKDE